LTSDQVVVLIAEYNVFHINKLKKLQYGKLYIKYSTVVSYYCEITTIRTDKNGLISWPVL